MFVGMVTCGIVAGIVSLSVLVIVGQPLNIAFAFAILGLLVGIFLGPLMWGFIGGYNKAKRENSRPEPGTAADRPRD
jgi:hypothetical protein